MHPVMKPCPQLSECIDELIDKGVPSKVPNRLKFSICNQEIAETERILKTISINI